MNKLAIFVVAAMGICCLVVSQAQADTTDAINVTVTLTDSISVALTGDDVPTWDIGAIECGGTPVVSTVVTATNDGNVAEDFKIEGEDANSWTIGASADEDVFVVKAAVGTPYETFSIVLENGTTPVSLDTSVAMYSGETLFKL